MLGAWALLGATSSAQAITTPSPEAESWPAAPPPAETAPQRGSQPPADSGVTLELPDEVEAEKEEEKLPWRKTRLLWSQSTTTQTVGVGSDYQSRNPTYDWALLFAPRYYFVDKDAWTLSARLEIGVARELTNSDTSTKQGEFDTVSGTSADTILAMGYTRQLYERRDYQTSIETLFPEFLIPTSTASRHNGTILGLGIGVFPGQKLPLLGTGNDFLRTLSLRGIARYRYFFTQATEPTNEDLGRIRTDIDGVPVASNQLGEAAFAQHQTRFGLDIGAELLARLNFNTRFEWRPSWKYRFSDDIEICNLATGCVTPSGVEDPQRFQVVTLFWPSLGYDVLDELSLSFAYVNLTNQIGPDGQRRNMFYSPEARFDFSVELNLDVLYQSLTRRRSGSAPSNQAGTSPALHPRF
jgi:hypothetical protein